MTQSHRSQRRKILKRSALTLATTPLVLPACDRHGPEARVLAADDSRQKRLASLSADPASKQGPAAEDLDAASRQWTVWTEPMAGGATPLLVAEGTALDLSALSSGVNRSRLGKRSFGFNLLGYRLPTAAEIPKFVASIRRNGQSFVRFFGLDPWFGHGSTVHPAGDPYGCAYDAKAVDLWWRYLAALSDAGIQYSVEFLYTAAAMLPKRSAWPDSPEPASQSIMLRATLNEPRAVEHWKHCFEVLCNRTNPYFAKPRKIVEDSNCLFIGSCNENNLWNRGNSYFGKGDADAASAIQPFFDEWQKAKGAGSHSVPAIGGGSAAASSAYGRFMLDAHAASYTNMRDHARAAGFKGQMSAVNYVPGLFDGVLRAETIDMVDCHMYFDLDDHGAGSSHRSLIGDRFFPSNWLAAGFIHGKRAAVSEFAMGGPSPWGYEFAFAYGLAALQDIDWIAQFARMNDSLDPRDPAVWTGWFEKHVQVGQDATKDVVSAAASRIGAFLFGRGDVDASPTVLGFVIRRDKTLASNPPWQVQWPRSLVDLGLLVGIRSVREADVDGQLKWIGTGAAPTRIYDPQNDSTIWKKPLATWISLLRAEGLLPAENRSDEAAGIFESATGQLRINARTRSARIVTPRSHVIIWDDDAQADETPFLMLDAATDRGLISIHDLSPEATPLSQTRRALLIHATEVRGSRSDGRGPTEFSQQGSMQWPALGYSNVPAYAVTGPKGTGWRKESWVPSRVRGGKAVVRLALPPGTVTIHRLDIRGNRLEIVPSERMKDGTVRVVLDNTSDKDRMQTVYYEVLRSDG